MLTYKNITLSLKMLILTIVVGVISWAIVDSIQSRTVKKTFDAQLSERLQYESHENSILFYRYLQSFYQNVKIIAAQKQFFDYVGDVKNKEWSSVPGSRDHIKYFTEPPQWLPKTSVLRAFAHFSYALLIDNRGNVREIYRNSPALPPGELLEPSSLLLQLSHQQNLMTRINGVPYIIVSESLYGSEQELVAAVMLATPLDRGFINDFLGSESSKKIVSLAEGRNPRIIVSNRDDLLPAGTLLDSLKDSYLYAGTGYSDYGSPDLEIEFFTLLPNTQSTTLSKSILMKERRSRIIEALLLILSFSLIMIWITKRIRRLTNKVIDFSERKLNTERQDLRGGDELEVLEGHFENMTDVIVLSHEFMKQQAESLRAERDRAQNYLDITGTAILALNASGEVVLINKKGCKALGYTEDEIIGKNWFDNFIPKRLINEEKTVFGKLISGALKPVESLENTVITKAGEERIFVWHNTLLKNDSGSIVGTLSSGEDITERKDLEQSIIEIEEWERQRIGHDLHDGLGQLLTGIAFKSQSMEIRLEEKSIEEARDAAEISLLVGQAKAQVSRLSRGLSPVEMDSEGLMAALELLASYTEKMFGIQCVFICDEPVTVHNKTAVTQLYRIAQEAVTNAVKHGKPGRIDISLKNENGKTIMTIQDDGTGIPGGMSDQATGMGLKIMRYRASLINASIDIRKGSDGGTRVICDISDSS